LTGEGVTAGIIVPQISLEFLFKVRFNFFEQGLIDPDPFFNHDQGVG